MHTITRYKDLIGKEVFYVTHNDIITKNGLTICKTRIIDYNKKANSYKTYDGKLLYPEDILSSIVKYVSKKEKILLSSLKDSHRIFKISKVISDKENKWINTYKISFKRIKAENTNEYDIKNLLSAERNFYTKEEEIYDNNHRYYKITTVYSSIDKFELDIAYINSMLSPFLFKFIMSEYDSSLANKVYNLKNNITAKILDNNDRNYDENYLYTVLLIKDNFPFNILNFESTDKLKEYLDENSI